MLGEGEVSASSTLHVLNDTGLLACQSGIHSSTQVCLVVSYIYVRESGWIRGSENVGAGNQVFRQIMIDLSLSAALRGCKYRRFQTH